MLVSKDTQCSIDGLHIYRTGEGIKLRESCHQRKWHSSEFYTEISVDKISQLPFSVYFEKSDGVISKINESNAEMLGFDSPDQAVGKRYYRYLSRKIATNLIQNDKDVMASNRIKLFEEIMVKDDNYCHHLSIKMPWYNDANQTIGTFGCIIPVANNTLATSLSMINGLGLLSIPQIQDVEHDLQFTPREKACLQLTIQGHTAKQIARQLSISNRTVEIHLANLKAKMNVSTKTEMVAKATKLYSFV